MFRVMFNTAFIRSNILILTRDDIDILWNAKERFPKDFRAEVSHSYLAALQLCALFACNSRGFMRSVMCCGWTHMSIVPWPTNSHLIFPITFFVCLCFSSWKKKNISPSVTKGQWTHGLHAKRFDLHGFGLILPQILTWSCCCLTGAFQWNRGGSYVNCPCDNAWWGREGRITDGCICKSSGAFQ
jgi:hypothetical protein